MQNTAITLSLERVVMRRTFFFLLVFIPASVLGQFHSVILPQSSLERTGLEQHLKSIYPQLYDKYTLSIKKTAELSDCFQSGSYIFCYLGVPIEGSGASFVQFNGKVILSAFLDPEIAFGPFCPRAGQLVWMPNADLGQYRLSSFTDVKGIRTYVDLATGKEFSEDMHRYSGKDSLVKVRVFMPDPLSRNNVLYGGVYRDRSDSTYAEVEAQQSEVMMNCLFENDSFRLQNTWISFAEVTPPLSAHAVTPGDMIFARNNPRFEEVNAFYHIQKLSEWWDSLGLGSFKDTVILDVHAYYGADESGFDPTAYPPTIEFGDGGVDDAEDADAPVHEYTHAAFNHVSPNSYFGVQRKAMEEGICDFMAVAYSYKLTSYQFGWVYNWDGHNEFWPGRNLNNQMVYPGSLTNQSHVDGQLFGAALFDLANEIGFDSAVKLIMFTMPLMGPNINMLQGAKLLIQADSVFFNGRYSWPLVKALYPRGLLPDVGVEDVVQNTLIIRNSLQFALGEAHLELVPLANTDITIVDLHGRICFQTPAKRGVALHISAEQLSAGAYVLQCAGMTYKILKF